MDLNLCLLSYFYWYVGYRHQGFYGKSYAPPEKLGMEKILHRVSIVVKGEKEVMRSRFRKYGITHIYGTASFTGEPNTVEVRRKEGRH